MPVYPKANNSPACYGGWLSHLPKPADNYNCYGTTGNTSLNPSQQPVCFTYAQKGVKPFVLPLFSLLKQSGYVIVLVSGSVDFIVQAIANHTNADFYHGTTPEIGSKSVYTGNITHQLDDHEKQKLITQIYDLSHSKTIAFGDSTGDIPMLSLADQAFIINPHQDELLELIKSNPSYHLVDENNIIQVVQKYLE